MRINNIIMVIMLINKIMTVIRPLIQSRVSQNEATKGTGAASGVDDDFIIISPEVCGRWIFKRDSLISSAEVAMGVLQGALQQVDLDQMERKDDMSIFVGAFHDTIVVDALT